MEVAYKIIKLQYKPPSGRTCSTIVATPSYGLYLRQIYIAPADLDVFEDTFYLINNNTSIQWTTGSQNYISSKIIIVGQKTVFEQKNIKKCINHA